MASLRGIHTHMKPESGVCPGCGATDRWVPYGPSGDGYGHVFQGWTCDRCDAVGCSAIAVSYLAIFAAIAAASMHHWALFAAALAVVTAPLLVRAAIRWRWRRQATAARGPLPGDRGRSYDGGTIGEHLADDAKTGS